MLNKLICHLNSCELNSFQGSLMQGYLMEKTSNEYGDYLHQQGLKPYSQAIYRTESECFWEINTLNQEAYQQLILPMFNEQIEQIFLKKSLQSIKIEKKELIETSYKILMQEFYNNESWPHLNLIFKTPTSFKSQGRYVNYPTLSLLYQSLMKKYSAANQQDDGFDEELLEELVNKSSIRRYHLQSTIFPMEGVKIPSFTGWISISIHGSTTLANYVRMLCRFGEYSGVGIKTAMGMGKIMLERKEGKK